jgi:hypothetical protein
MDAPAAIRDRLAVLDEIDIMYEHDRAGRALDALRDAVQAVVDLHAPREPTEIEAAGLASYERGQMVCTVCATSAGQMGPREVYPCTTVRAIMGRIGVRS